MSTQQVNQYSNRDLNLRPIQPRGAQHSVFLVATQAHEAPKEYEMTTMMTERSTFEESVKFGEKVGLYEAIAQAGPVTAGELARLTGLPTTQIARWLKSQVAGQFVTRALDPERYQTWCDIPRN